MGRFVMAATRSMLLVGAFAALVALVPGQARADNASPAPSSTERPYTLQVGNDVQSLVVTKPGVAVNGTFAGTAGRVPTLQIVDSALDQPATLTLIGPDKKPRTSVPVVTGAFRALPALDADGRWTLKLTPAATEKGQVRLLLSYAVAAPPALTLNVVTPLAMPAPGEVAAFTFAGVKGRRPTLTSAAVRWTSAGGLSTYPTVQASLFRPNGTAWSDLDAIGPGASTAWGEPQIGSLQSTLDVSGTWTLVFRGVADEVGSQTIRLALVSDQKKTVVPGAATVVKVTTKGQNALYRFTGVVGRRVTVDLASAAWQGAQAATMYLLRPDGSILDVFDRVTRPMPAPDFFESEPLDAPGTWTLLVDPTGPSIGGQQFVLDQVGDPAAVPADLDTPLAVAVTTPGAVASLRVPAVAGRRLVVSWTGGSWTSRGADAGLGAVAVRLSAADGRPLAWSSMEHGAAGSLDLDPVAAADGTWTLQLDPLGDAIGSATVVLSTVADVTADAALGVPLDVALDVAHQRARYGVTLAAGKHVVARVSGSTFAPGVVRVTLQDRWGTTTQMEVAPQDGDVDLGQVWLAGPYTVMVDPDGEATGSLGLTLTQP